MGLKTYLLIFSFVLSIGMIITLLVFWNIYIIGDYHTMRELGVNIPAAGRWSVLTLGIVFFSAILVIFSLFFVNILRTSRFKQQQKDFVNMMTHELKMPMSSIQIFAQTLKHRNVAEAEREKFVNCILDECGRMNFLVHQLLQSQQIEKGELPLEKRRVEITELARRFVDNWPRPLEFTAGARGYANVDPVLIEFALTNLVNNAEKYGRGSVPSVIAAAENGQVNISVRDQSDVIPKQYQKKIFQKFFRIPNRQTRKQNGVGLGLYIVKTITRVHKGHVKVSSADGPPGNLFTLTFPRIP